MAPKIEKATRKEFPDGIKAHGTDAVRFNFCALAATGRDIRFDMNRLEGYRNFCNKIWNATRFILMNVEESKIDLSGDKTFSVADIWIQSELQNCISATHKYYKEYRFDLLSQTIHDFTWNTFCAWYIEIAKPVLYDTEDIKAKRGTLFTLVSTLESLMRIIHPLMPYITEEIWQKLTPILGIKGESVMVQSYPEIDKSLIDEESISTITWLQDVVTTVRNIRGEMNISPAKTIPVLLHKGDDKDKELLKITEHFLKSLAKVDSIEWLESDTLPPAATGLVNQLEILIPLKGLIDKDKEAARLQKSIDKIAKELIKIESKLKNKSFLEKAPKEVVDKENVLLSDLSQKQNKLQAHLTKIQAL